MPSRILLIDKKGGQLREAKRANPITQDRGKKARGDLVRTIGVKDSADERSSLGMAICKFDQFVQRTLMNDRVRIQDEGVFAAARTDTGIVAPSETKILLVLNDSYCRIVLPNEFDRTVDRAVIRNNDLEVCRV